MNISCYIVDDEIHAIELLSRFIERTPGLELAGSSNYPLEALNEIATIGPMVVFVDIDMPELNGLQLTELLNRQTAVIYTTAFREYALEAFEHAAADYLLKPVAYERFLKSVQKLRKHFAETPVVAGQETGELFVKSGQKGKLIRVLIRDILYISSAMNYIELHFKEQRIITYLTLSEVLEKLPEHQFSRIHHSFIVNHSAITALEYGQVKLNNLASLPVGRAFRLSFREKLNAFILISKRER